MTVGSAGTRACGLTSIAVVAACATPGMLPGPRADETPEDAVAATSPASSTTGTSPANSAGGTSPANSASSTSLASSATTASPATLVASGPACPPPEPRGAGYPPWEIRPTRERCIRGPEGRWSATRDPTDRDGWRHHLRFDGADGSGWTLEVTSPTSLARRTDGQVVVLDLKRGVTLVSAAGVPVWRSTHPECGAVDSLAVGWDHAVTFSCGLSVIRLEPDGQLAWQVWPFGDHHVRGMWVDRAGVSYVSGNGGVAALGPDGQARWTTSTGFNRAVGRLVWNRAGHLVFDTSMGARHSDPSTSGGYRFYYDPEPNELLELDRSGAVVRRTPYESTPPKGGWPAVLPVGEDGGHRVP